MQAKSILGEKRGAVRHFYATVIRGEVSDANVQGYLRAASQIEANSSRLETAELMDRETGLRDLVDILERILAETGDLIVSRSPELAAEARAALGRSGDPKPGPAE